MNLVFLNNALGAFSVVTVLTNGAGQHSLMLRAAVRVNRVTAYAGDRRTIFQNVANIGEDMPVVIRLRKIDFEIVKEIVAGHEVVGIREAAALRFARVAFVSR